MDNPVTPPAKPGIHNKIIMMTRRHALKTIALSSVAGATITALHPSATEAAQGSASGPFTVPPLAYAFDALEPHIDARTMEIHHDKHHAAYVANANAALEKHPELGSKTVEDLLWGINTIPEDIRTAIRNNAGGHANHTIF